jgi:hypothetical protein
LPWSTWAMMAILRIVWLTCLLFCGIGLQRPLESARRAKLGVMPRNAAISILPVWELPTSMSGKGRAARAGRMGGFRHPLFGWSEGLISTASFIVIGIAVMPPCSDPATPFHVGIKQGGDDDEGENGEDKFHAVRGARRSIFESAQSSLIRRTLDAAHFCWNRHTLTGRCPEMRRRALPGFACRSCKTPGRSETRRSHRRFSLCWRSW